MMQNRLDTILDYFERINAIPRCSKHEQRLRQWLKAWADARALDSSTDAAGNLVVRVPSAPGESDRPVIVIQGHMDMVCEKSPDSNHDFSADPIRSRRDGDWITADRTTLGADNGIAIAYALTLAEATDIRRPPMELLFTVDEETGLNGAKAMSPDLISGRVLINLDSEDEGVFTVGCAGGLDTWVELGLPTEPVGSDRRGWKLVVGGLQGGHSGIDIHKRRANANKVLARTLNRIQQTTDAFHVSVLQGGTRHNAIPRDAQAVIVAPDAEEEGIHEAVASMRHTIAQEYTRETGFTLTIEPHPLPGDARCLTTDATLKTIEILLGMPHGVAGMSATVEGLVETSSNLAVVRLDEGNLKILSSQRSAVASRLVEVTETVHAVAGLAGATWRDENKYPAWRPDMDSELLQVSQRVFRTLFDKDPVLQVIHAGLECAVIGDRHPGMQMISFGPTIRNPHSPTERLHIPSVDKVWRFLAALVEALGR